MENTNFQRLSTSKFLELYSLSYIINKNSEVYGKEILDTIKQHNLSWSPSHGSFYPVLNTMLNDGLIQCAYEYDTKKYYNITEEGRRYFKERASLFRDALVKASDFYYKIAENLPEK